MIYISRRKCFVFLFFLLIFIFSLTTAHKKEQSVFSQALTHTVIIDAGHGFPDGGAVGMNGSIESTLNIKIANLIKKELEKSGHTVIMTRKGEDSICRRDGETIAKMKRNDMYKRLDIIKSSSADIFVSIHMNKFTDSRYCGAQVLYADNYRESEKLASFLQKRLCDLEDNKTKRTHSKAPKELFLMKNTSIPSVIIECGFLSNYEEEKLLNSEKYQKELCGAIVKGIKDYYLDFKKTKIQ